MERHVEVVNDRKDMIGILSGTKNTQSHLWLALLCLFNYLEAIGCHAGHLAGPLKATPKAQYDIDLKAPNKISFQNLCERFREFSHWRFRSSRYVRLAPMKIHTTAMITP